MRFPLFSAEPNWPAGQAIVRLTVGALMARHGLDVFDSEGMRGMGEWLATDLHLPAGLLMAYLAKGAEFFGGILLAIGLFTRLSALLVAITMAVAVVGAHGDAILKDGEVALLYLLLFGAFFFAGPGRWSVDYWLAARREPNR